MWVRFERFLDSDARSQAVDAGGCGIGDGLLFEDHGVVEVAARVRCEWFFDGDVRSQAVDAGSCGFGNSLFGEDHGVVQIAMGMRFEGMRFEGIADDDVRSHLSEDIEAVGCWDGHEDGKFAERRDWRLIERLNL